MDSPQLDSSPSFLPQQFSSGPGKSRSHQQPAPRCFSLPSTLAVDLSPAASLAAELSQNFHIAPSPLANPTPRKALFPVAFSSCASETSLSTSSSLASFASAASSLSSISAKRKFSHSISAFDDKPLLPAPESTSTPAHPVQAHALGDDSLSDIDSPLNVHRARPQLTTLTRDSFDSSLASTASASASRRSKFRRTQSMFQHPKDVLPPPDISPLAAATTNSIPASYVNDDPFMRIERDTLCDILDGKYSSLYTKTVVVDCRFEYEYDGGHIDGAINVNSADKLEQVLFADRKPGADKMLLVFHCEYSAHRGPLMAGYLRKIDRQLNSHRYPELDYPDIAILRGGYSSFFEQHAIRCVPQQYVEMNDSLHKVKCDREFTRFRKFFRTQSCTLNSTTAAKSSLYESAAAKSLYHGTASFTFPRMAPADADTSADDTLDDIDACNTPIAPRRRQLTQRYNVELLFD